MELRLILKAVAAARETFSMEVQFHGWDGARCPRVAALTYSALFVGRVAVCAVVGHRFEDIGGAGPESGCTDIVCTRCGLDAGRTILY